MMLGTVLFLSGVSFGFIIGTAVAIRMLSHQRFAASRETAFEIRNPVDLCPSEFSHDWSLFE